MGPLQIMVSWDRMRHAGEQAARWDIQNKENSNLTGWSHFVLDVPVPNLLSSMADSVPCDHYASVNSSSAHPPPPRLTPGN